MKRDAVAVVPFAPKEFLDDPVLKHSKQPPAQRYMYLSMSTD